MDLILWRHAQAEVGSPDHVRLNMTAGNIPVSGLPWFDLL